jgi:calcineurin-like phosphoesterase family protein
MTTSGRCALPWAEPPRDLHEITVEGYRLVLCHYPLAVWNRRHYGSVHLHGHSHGALASIGMRLDVGVDAWDFRPCSLPEILARLNSGGEDV